MSQKKYISPDKSKTFALKTPKVQVLINHTLFILENFGIPIEGTPRRLERMAIAFLATADIKSTKDINSAKDLNNGYALKTRAIIEYINEHFQENISSGSYDDIRRKDLKLLVVGGIVLQSSPNSATNDSTRGYGLNPMYANLLRQYPNKSWQKTVKEALKDIEPIAERLKRKRKIKKVPVLLPSGKKLEFSPGLHNDLQKAIIEEVLPRYGYNAKVLYVGDTSDKYLHLDQDSLNKLNFCYYSGSFRRAK